MAAYLLRLVFGVSLIGLAGSASGALFERDWLAPGDGLLTYDDVNQREWLDLTETQLFMYPGNSLAEQLAAVLDETQSGGRFEGFAYAAEGDVRDLAISGGIDITTIDFDVNQEASLEFINLVGNTIDPAIQTSNRRSEGLANSILPDTVVPMVAFVPIARIVSAAGYEVFLGTAKPSLDGEIRSGVWLYRQVPEPSSALVVCTLLPFLFASRLKRSIRENRGFARILREGEPRCKTMSFTSRF